MDSLTTALTCLIPGRQQPIHSAYGAVIASLIEQGGINRCRGYVSEALAVEKAEQRILLGRGEGQRWPCSLTWYYMAQHGWPAAQAFAIDERPIHREGLASRPQSDAGSEFGHRSHHSSSLVSSVVGRPS